MKKLINTLFAGDLVKDLFNGVDQLTTTREEKDAVKALMQRNLGIIQTQLEAGITERHKADMASDSWLSKNIRPMTLIFILLCYVILSIMDAWTLHVKEVFIELLGQWGMLVMSFYFGSRGVEKVFEIKNRIKE